MLAIILGTTTSRPSTRTPATVTAGQDPVRHQRRQPSPTHQQIARKLPLGTGVWQGRPGGPHRYSRAVSRAPRTVMTTTPAAKTRAAQSAAPRSCGGRAGQTHGVVHGSRSAYSATTM